VDHCPGREGEILAREEKKRLERFAAAATAEPGREGGERVERSSEGGRISQNREGSRKTTLKPKRGLSTQTRATSFENNKRKGHCMLIKKGKVSLIGRGKRKGLQLTPKREAEETEQSCWEFGVSPRLWKEGRKKAGKKRRTESLGQ